MVSARHSTCLCNISIAVQRCDKLSTFIYRHTDVSGAPITLTIMGTIKKFGLGLFLAIIMISAGNTNQAAAQARFGISFQTFYDELEPYGRWIHDREYGYVWSPGVSRNFQPYATNGRWVVTEYGNTWLSDYPWGWAPFHYGRWTFDDFYGWIWVPGYEWGPAWVSWRHGGGYYGWAPLPPGINIHVSINIPASRWIFVPQRYITSPRIYNYYAPRTRVVNIYNHTTIINNYYDRDNRTYVYGPRRSDIERATRSKVAVHRIHDAERPGRPEVRSGSVSIYRPQTSAANSRTETSRPSRSTESTYSRNERSSTPSERNTASERVSSERNNTPQNNNTARERPSRSESPRYSEPSNRNSGSQGRISSESRPEPQPQQRSSRPQRSQQTEVKREASRTQSTRTESTSPQSRGNSQGNSSSSSRESSGRPSR